MKAHIITAPNVLNDEVIQEIITHLGRLGINSSPISGVSVDIKSTEDYFKKAMQSIKTADFVVAEISNNSLSLGFEIAFAITEKKPVICFYKDDASASNLDKNLLLGANSKYLRLKKYSRTEEVLNALKFFKDDIKDIIDTKFILIIPAFIDSYLEWNVKRRGISKAEVTRKAIEKAMQSDKEYTEFINSGGL